jgi:hypothetical protein
MRHRRRVFPCCALATLTVLWACDGHDRQVHKAEAVAAAAPPPTSVACADAPQLRERAGDARRQREASSSDQERIIAGNRASFFASLAIIADVGCSVPLSNADPHLGEALASARQASGASSFYQAATHWSEAGLLATQAIALLIREGSTPPEP